MKFSEKIFGKRLFEISYEDFATFFQEKREESGTLEFKSGMIEIHDIFKEICAFLNTDGGLLVIGSPLEKNDENGKRSSMRYCQGIPVASTFKDKAWIMKKLCANISPAPKNIDIHEILTDQGNFFILDIPQSTCAPHQCASDGRYYIRVGEQSKPAPHGIVKALFFRNQKPSLLSTIDIQREKNTPENQNYIAIHIQNHSEYPANNVSYRLDIMNTADVHVLAHINTNGSLFEKLGENTFRLQHTTDYMIMDGTDISLECKLIHNFQPYMVSLLVWNKEYGVYHNRFIWDPSNFQYISKYQTGDEPEITLHEMIDTVKEIIHYTG